MSKLAKTLAYSGVSVGIAVLLSMITIYHMPQGGSVTACSMLFIALPAYWFGPVVGITAGVACGLIQFIIKPEIFHPIQVLMDYPLAFGVIGVAGFFRNNKHGLVTGYVTGALLRCFMSFLSGYIFFASYAPEGIPPALYSAGYNLSYILPEIIITCVLVSLPPVKKIVQRISY